MPAANGGGASGLQSAGTPRGRRRLGRWSRRSIQFRAVAENEESDFGKAVSRILSAPRASARRRESFVSAAKTRDRGCFRSTGSGPLRSPLFGLAPDGVFRASAIALGAVGFYPTFSPLPADAVKRSQAVCFLWHCPSGGLAAPLPACIRLAEAKRLRGIAPCGVRTFLPWPKPEAILRLSKINWNLEPFRQAGKAAAWPQRL